MPAFFETPKQVTHNGLLHDYQQKSISFNPEDAAHTNLIKECTNEVNTHLAVLHNIDKHIIGGFALGTASMALSFILPFCTLSIVGFAYGAYCLGKREQADKDYRKALQNLVNAGEWSKTSDKAPEAIVSMIETLAPLMSAKELVLITNPKTMAAIKPRLDGMINDNLKSICGYDLSPKAKEVYSNIYGFDKGKLWDVLKGLTYFSSQAFLFAKGAVTNYFDAAAKAVVPPAPTSPLSSH